MEPWLLPEDDREEAAKEGPFLRLGKDSWDRIRGISGDRWVVLGESDRV
jgi:hypothetical protein